MQSDGDDPEYAYYAASQTFPSDDLKQDSRSGFDVRFIPDNWATATDSFW